MKCGAGEAPALMQCWEFMPRLSGSPALESAIIRRRQEVEQLDLVSLWVWRDGPPEFQAILAVRGRGARAT